MMRRHSNISTLALVCLATAWLVVPLAAQPPADAPLDFTATALDGTEFDVGTLAGKAVLLDFWGTWCAPCVHAFPKLNQLHEEFGDELEIVGLAFYSGEPETVAEFAAEHDLAYRVLVGYEETIERFGILAFPSYILFSADGEMLFSQAGQMTDLYERVAAHFTPEPAAHTAVAANADS